MSHEYAIINAITLSIWKIFIISQFSKFPHSFERRVRLMSVRYGRVDYSKEVGDHEVADGPALHLLLVISSCFFMIPGVYAFMNGVYLLAILSCITTVVSINYWRDAVNGWRRNADLLIAKMSFLIYFITGVVHIRDWHILLVGWPNTGLILGSYYLANALWVERSDYWIIFHMAFHFFVSIGQLIVVHGSYVVMEQ